MTLTLCKGGECRCVRVCKLLRYAGGGVRRGGCVGHLRKRELQR